MKIKLEYVVYSSAIALCCAIASIGIAIFKNSIFHSGFMSRAVKNILPNYPTDYFNIENLCYGQAEFIESVRKTISSDFGFNFAHGFEGYMVYFNNLSSEQKFAFFNEMNNYFKMNPDLIQTYFNNEESYKNFMEYCNKEFTEATKSGNYNVALYFCVGIAIAMIVGALISFALHYTNPKKICEKNIEIDGFGLNHIKITI